MKTMSLQTFQMRRRHWLLAAFAVFVLGGCAWIETKQGEWIFNPVQSEWRGFRGLPEGWSEQWIPVGSRGEKIHAWWAPAADPQAPVLLYLHGARWNMTGSVTRVSTWCVPNRLVTSSATMIGAAAMNSVPSPAKGYSSRRHKQFLCPGLFLSCFGQCFATNVGIRRTIADNRCL